MQSELPPGLAAIYTACTNLYPSQRNPLQVTASPKYWLKGQDPLDYVSMYFNSGSKELSIPPHWHYVSFGLSDLFGDGRVHQIRRDSQDSESEESGAGFELTFRLKQNSDESDPPTWPVSLMQALARHVFLSNTLLPGDFIWWHAPLDEHSRTSAIKHVLLAEDPQLLPIRSPFGTVRFTQIVGICEEELEAVQQWNGSGVIQLLKSNPFAGGNFLITDMNRSLSIFALNSLASRILESGIREDGSNLAGVGASIIWEEWFSEAFCSVDGNVQKSTQNGLRSISNGTEMFLSGLSLTFDRRAGVLLPLVLKGRLLHGRHFTFRCVGGLSEVTFVSHKVTGCFVDSDKPFALRDGWLQVMIVPELLDKMICDSAVLERFTKSNDNQENHVASLYPLIFSWPFFRLRIVIP